MKISGRAFALAFAVTLVVWALAHAATVDQIWQLIWDSTNHALRINVVAS